ncbi:hypothetical protein OS493_024511 [Desmophyllum pertusum]|uniref:Uncharacterized protein n=1 Tax=Desmophyllum pertusum TaxID=174260 RepID=A0A9W9YDR2_9CNID|nr:hypothetical protein OS493_024511 [Desmophyllum pertusum]
MDLEDLSNFWARFQIAFSWDYPEGLDVQAVQSAVFHVVGDGETRAQDQLVLAVSSQLEQVLSSHDQSHIVT